MKKRLIWVASLAACVCLALGVVAVLPERPGVTKANFDRIEKGMTRLEVVEIFGEDRSFVFPFIVGSNVTSEEQWDSEDGASARIAFVDRKMALKKWRPSRETIPEKIRRWLRM